MAILVGGIVVGTPSAWAQDLEPRAFSPAPVGMNFGVLLYGYSKGNILFDQSVPIENAEGEVHSASLAYVRTLDLFGLTSKLLAVVPYAWGDWQGDVEGEYRTTSRTGFADPSLQLTVNFLGAPAITLAEMRDYREGTIAGASLLVTVPVGQYDPSKLINLSTHRWVFRPRVGVSHRAGRWTIEALGSVLLFTQNDEAYLSSTLTQDPIWGLSADAIYSFKRGFWLGVGAGMGRGGQTTVDGIEKDTYQRNGRVGATLVYPLGRLSSLKLTYINSLRTDRGTDFDTLTLAYQLRWGGGL
jgi:hypothetical protein